MTDEKGDKETATSEPSSRPTQKPGVAHNEIGPSGSTTSKTSKPFGRITREISPEHLKEEGTQRMILGELDRLDQEVNDLREFREKYYGAEKNRAVVQTKLDSADSIQQGYKNASVLASVCYSVGGVLLGFAPAVHNDNYLYRTVIFFGFVTILAAAISQYKNK